MPTMFKNGQVWKYPFTLHSKRRWHDTRWHCMTRTRRYNRRYQVSLKWCMSESTEFNICRVQCPLITHPFQGLTDLVTFYVVIFSYSFVPKVLNETDEGNLQRKMMPTYNELTKYEVVIMLAFVFSNCSCWRHDSKLGPS